MYSYPVPLCILPPTYSQLADLTQSVLSNHILLCLRYTYMHLRVVCGAVSVSVLGAIFTVTNSQDGGTLG